MIRRFTLDSNYDELKLSVLEITPEALRAIAAEAIKHGTGARGLRSICERVLQDTMYTLPSEEGRVARVIVDEDCVVSGAPATLEYAA